jgi:uncharacterized protein (TIRG00374 family)
MRQRLLSLLAILLGIAGFCAIPFIVGFRDLVQTIGQVGWFSIALFVVNASSTLLIPAVGWWILMRAEGIPASLGTAVQANLMGFPLDFVVPSIYLGGEPLKVVYIAKVCHVTPQRALATIIVAKFQELGGLVLALIVATALFVWHTDYFMQRNEVLLTAAIVILAALFGLTLHAFAGHLKPMVRLITLLARFHVFERQLAQLRTLAEEIEELIHSAVTLHIRSVVLAQAITCLSAVSVFVRPWIFSRPYLAPASGLINSAPSSSSPI